MRAAFTLWCLSATTPLFAQEAKPPPGSDAALAERLGADQRGMKSYVLVLLKTGPKTDIPKGE